MLYQTDLKELKIFKKGKVRDVYDLGNRLLIVATDRISCFDVVLPTPVPDKGKILTRISLFWFNFLKDVIPNHFISGDTADLPDIIKENAADLESRFMLTKKCEVVPFECVVRGYLSGSGWKEYSKSQSVCGIKLPAGLAESDKLPEPIFTPATKAESGHDENVSFEFMSREIDSNLAERIRNLSISIYKRASEYAQKRGIIIADTKFEFGLFKDNLILVDEVLTPDSSRFWPKDKYMPGGPQPSFDKQFVRDYLETLDWDKTPPGPALPDDIVEQTASKYKEVVDLLIGK